MSDKSPSILIFLIYFKIVLMCNGGFFTGNHYVNYCITVGLRLTIIDAIIIICITFKANCIIFRFCVVVDMQLVC